ncbi:MAG: bifunctional tetrahydrofolate synthase/dihydrofolate synthase [Pigmentiphaga sp.]|nr:bifunctional tetrahydrofolate synthase/dihydrofolate synthase [Pigmentiphaga sp.]
MTATKQVEHGPAVRPGPGQPLSAWLSYLESIHHRPIELGLDRIREVAERMGLLQPNCLTIIVGGTNGKGSTCAMLEAVYLAAGYRVGLSTSPHLIDFNERARVNGEIASDAALIAHFERVEQARGTTPLTYFEFSTLAILSLFSESSLDVMILEVGLGGRLDAVNILDADCSIITSIDVDHVDWLGSDREAIGFEKAHIYRPGRPAICADPMPPQSLLDYAHQIGADLWRFGHDYNYAGDRQQWNYGGRHNRRNALAYPALRGANQLLNASGALAVVEALSDRLPVPQQAVRLGLLKVELPGRFQILPGQPTVILDVAHNPHAAAVLADNLGNMGFYPYTHAVFGMLDDKDIAQVIEKMKGVIDHWHCATLDVPRGASAQVLRQKLEAAGVVNGKESSLATHENVAEAYLAATEQAADGDRIIVFGSFHTVAGVLVHLRNRKVAAS